MQLRLTNNWYSFLHLKNFQFLIPNDSILRVFLYHTAFFPAFDKTVIFIIFSDSLVFLVFYLSTVNVNQFSHFFSLLSVTLKKNRSCFRGIWLVFLKLNIFQQRVSGPSSQPQHRGPGDLNLGFTFLRLIVNQNEKDVVFPIFALPLPSSDLFVSYLFIILGRGPY